MELSEKQKDMLTKYRELLVYGSSILEKVLLDQRKTKMRKLIFHSMMVAQQSYSEAILALMLLPGIYDKAAEVLQRSLIENFINANYIYSGFKQERTYIFIIESWQDRIDFAIKQHKLMDKYPKWELQFDDKKRGCDWDSFILQKKYEILKIQKRYKMKFGKRVPDLRTRAIAFDSWLEKRGKLKPNKSLEKQYVYFYKYYSQIAHLLMSGLERFHSVDEKGILRVDVNGQPSDIERVVTLSYTLYFVMLNWFMRQFHIKDKENLLRFNKISKDLIKNN